MTIYRIVHTSDYHFAQPVLACSLEARLSLRDTPRQTCLAGSIQCVPLPTDRGETTDDFGNRVIRLAFKGPLQRLSVSAVQQARVEAVALPARSVPWEAVAQAPDRPEIATLRRATSLVDSNPGMARYAQAIFGPRRDLLDALTGLSHSIHSDFAYDPGATDTATTASAAFALRRGVCQDFAQVAIACCRSVGLPARYVSGYLDTKALQARPPAIARDHSHAWFSVHAQDLGWIDFDPTLGCPVEDHHILAAWGRDYNDVAPITGRIEGGGAQRLSVSVDVRRI